MRPAIRPCLSAFLLAAALSAGCIGCPETHVSMDTLVADYNTNAGRVPRLWARAKIHLTIRDEKGRRASWGSTSPLASPNGILLLSKADDALGPHDFALIGRETLAMDLFGVGSSASEGKYYLWYSYGDRGRAWWGLHKLAGAAGIEQIPIDPNQLLSVLAVCDLPSDFTQMPTVTMRMSTNPCAYVLTCLERQAVTNRIIFTKDIYFRWDDTDLRQPFLVKLFDPSGEQVMVARLARFRPIETESPADPPPVMPTEIRISWPARGNKVHVLLSEMTTADKWDPQACRFLDPETGDLPGGISHTDVIQVDSALVAGGSQQ